MAKGVKNYFSHDSDARNDPKVARLRMSLGMEGYGIYFALLEMMREADNYELPTDYEMIAWELHTDADKVKAVVEDYGLFTIGVIVPKEEHVFFSPSFIRRMEMKDDISKARSEAGKKGGISKALANSSKVVANDKQSSSKVVANDKQSSSKVVANDKQSSSKVVANDKQSSSKVVANSSKVKVKDKVKDNIISPSTTSPAREGVVGEREKSEQERWYVEMANDESFIETAALQNKVAVETVKMQLSAFYAEVTATKHPYAYESDFRDHALKWVRRSVEIARDRQKQRGMGAGSSSGGKPAAAKESIDAYVAPDKARDERQMIVETWRDAVKGGKRSADFIEAWAKNGRLESSGLRVDFDELKLFDLKTGEEVAV